MRIGQFRCTGSELLRAASPADAAALDALAGVDLADASAGSPPDGPRIVTVRMHDRRPPPEARDRRIRSVRGSRGPTHLLVPDAVRDALDRIAGHPIAWTPVEVENLRWRLWRPSAPPVVDALDPGGSRFRRSRDGRVTSIDRHAFRPEALGSLALFRLPERRSALYCDDRLPAALRELGVVGWWVHDVWVAGREPFDHQPDRDALLAHPEIYGPGGFAPAPRGRWPDAWFTARELAERDAARRCPEPGRVALAAPRDPAARRATPLPARRVTFERVDAPVAGGATKFGGRPDGLEPGRWPVGRTHGTPMNFLCRVRLADTGVERFAGAGDAAAFVFMAFDEDYDALSGEPGWHDNAVLLRPDGVDPPLEYVDLVDGPSLHDVEWEFDDARHGPEYAVRLTPRVEPPEPGPDDFDDEDAHFEALESWAETASGTKLGGAPVPVQLDLHGTDERDWHQVLQLDGTDVPFDVPLGDGGVLHVLVDGSMRHGLLFWQAH